MKNPTSRLFPASLLLALIVALIPVPAYAALGITSVSPNQIVNNTETTITISGTDFVPGSTVVLINGSALATDVQNASKLTAVVPAGLAVGCYTLTVSTGAEPDVTWDCLNVVAPAPTTAPTATSEPLPFVRPQFVVRQSRINGSVSYNSEFKLTLGLENAGTSGAYSIQVAFTSADLVPLKTGGVVVLNSVNAGEGDNISQQFLVTGTTFGKAVIPLDVTVTYYDDAGTSYSDKFTLSLPTSGGGSGVIYATSTPTGVKSSQLVITSYAASIDPLQPGEQFTITMTVQNMGNARAQRVTMIVGGGSSGGSGGETPVPGGVSGGGGEFTNFAPVGASNVQSLGDLGVGEMIQASQNLIVNVSTSPGAYPMKVTFSYLNEKNEPINDEQVITLLVYSLPNVDVSFYRPPDPFFAGQPGMLPIQVVNIGKRSAVLGNIKVETEAGTVENATGLVGAIDTGGYFTIDSMLIPEQAGQLTVNVTIDYTDDFNQARTLTRTLQVEVMEAMIEEPVIDPSMEGGGGMPVPSDETTLQKIWRFILGLLGLDSAPPAGGEDTMPPVEEPGMEVPPGRG
jgi:hypothetical protein